MKELEPNINSEETEVIPPERAIALRPPTPEEVKIGLESGIAAGRVWARAHKSMFLRWDPEMSSVRFVR